MFLTPLPPYRLKTINQYCHFWTHFTRMAVQKAFIDTFSGSTNLWGLLGDSGLSNITHWQTMGLIRGLQGQIWDNLTSFATFGPISPRMTI